jgi:hypothetical protein
MIPGLALLTPDCHAASGLAFTQAFFTGQVVRTGQQFAADWHTGFGP